MLRLFSLAATCPLDAQIVPIAPGHCRPCCFLPQQQELHNSDVTGQQFHARVGNGPERWSLEHGAHSGQAPLVPAPPQRQRVPPGRAKGGRKSMVQGGDPPPDFPWLLVSGYPTRSGTGTWGMRADAYIKPAQKRKASHPALPEVPPPSWHCTRLSAAEATSPPPNGNTSSKTRKQPGGRAPLQKAEPGKQNTRQSWLLQRQPRPKQGGVWLRAPSTRHPRLLCREASPGGGWAAGAGGPAAGRPGRQTVTT